MLRRVERSGAEAVLMLLVGDDAVQFNRAFARAGLDQQVLRLSTLMEENMLLASGADSTRDLFASAGFFDSLATSDSLDFIGRFSARYGPEAPVLNSLGESCYEGVRLLVQLVRRAGSPDVDRICAVADTVGYDGPRGRCSCGAATSSSGSTWPGPTAWTSRSWTSSPRPGLDRTLRARSILPTSISVGVSR